MIAAISLMRHLAPVGLARFRRHWLDVHGPLVCAFPRLRRYVQCHVIDSPVMNQRARDARIDGFPILFFEDDADRQAAHDSPEMAACNIDSRLFVGAVSRVITCTEPVFVSGDGRGRFCLLVLFPETASAAEIEDGVRQLRDLPRLRALNSYHVLVQGRAPASTIPHLPMTVAGVLQAAFDSLVDLECALADRPTLDAAMFVAEEHWLA